MRVRLCWLLLLLSFRGPAAEASVLPTVRSDDELWRDLQALTDEMARAPVRGEPMLLYAHAFAGYALVNAGLLDPARAPAAGERLDRLIDHVLTPALGTPFHAGTVAVAGRTLSASVALRGHLALMLVGRSLLGQVAPGRAALLQALLHGLAADLQRDPRHLLPTYGRRTWPADNEVVAAALSLYLQRISQDAMVAAGLAALQASLERLESGGLPPSEIEADRLRGRPGAVPRGCALSWTVAMRGLYDPVRAAALYQRYRAAFFVSLGPVVGFREWPPGVDRRADADSGPIILGIGTAASGIGLGASRLAGAMADHRALLASARLAGMQRIERQNAHYIERAMALWARTARTFKG